MYTDTAIISTSDRGNFKDCRRKWNWQSHLRQGLIPLEQAAPLWFGSGFHYALEDFYGYQAYGPKGADKYTGEHACAAFDDYAQATKTYYGEENLPINIDDLTELGHGMLTYFIDVWLRKRGRSPLKTYVVNGVPQVEVPFEIEIPLTRAQLAQSNYKRVVYKGVIDRVVIDENGMLWLEDYKTTKNTPKYSLAMELDNQIGSYYWAASHIYDKPIAGFLYSQFKKAFPKLPRELKSGALSIDKQQGTCYSYFRDELIKRYGSVEMIPEKDKKYKEFMYWLMGQEDDDYDLYVGRTPLHRTKKSLWHYSQKIIIEAADMVDRNVAIYNNPDLFMNKCSFCSFNEACIAYEKGENYSRILDENFKLQDYADRSNWATHLKVNPHEGKEVQKVPLTV